MGASQIDQKQRGIEAESEPSLTSQIPIVELPARNVDLVLLGAVLALVTVGMIEVSSASSVYALKKYGDSLYFLKRQVIWVALGFGALWVGARTNYVWLRRYAYPLLAGSLFLLVTVLWFGAEINHARRWFLLGPLSIQPVEIAKLGLITFLAYSLAKKADKVKMFTVGFVPHLLVSSVMMGLLLLQPDLGSSVLLGITTLVLLFVSGAKISYIVLAVLASAPVVYHLIVGTPWRLMRFMAYLNPQKYSHGVAYQVVQSRIAVGSGGLSGYGIGSGPQRLGYMPEGHSDFIMASVGEELGFIGFAMVLLLFGVILWRGVRAALGARDLFGSYLAFGITATLCVQAFIHTGVVLGVLPAKGITIPFISYGGSSLVATMFTVGVLLNIAQRMPLLSPSRELVNYVGARRRKQRAIIKCAS